MSSLFFSGSLSSHLVSPLSCIPSCLMLGKGKWIPYTPIITHNTPLPNHDRTKPRRRSEDHAGLRERRSSEKVINTEPVSHPVTNNNNPNRRRASVPPPTREYNRRYSQSGDNHIGHHSNGGSSYRGGRRGGRGVVSSIIQDTLCLFNIIY